VNFKTNSFEGNYQELDPSSSQDSSERNECPFI